VRRKRYESESVIKNETERFTTNVEPAALSDLDAQRLLAAMLADGVLPRPNARTILVIFLDANLQSTLGSLAAGKHYAAYHSALASTARESVT
jgi:hypothetical protein